MTKTSGQHRRRRRDCRDPCRLDFVVVVNIVDVDNNDRDVVGIAINVVVVIVDRTNTLAS